MIFETTLPETVSHSDLLSEPLHCKTCIGVGCAIPSQYQCSPAQYNNTIMYAEPRLTLESGSGQIQTVPISASGQGQEMVSQWVGTPVLEDHEYVNQALIRTTFHNHKYIWEHISNRNNLQRLRSCQPQMLLNETSCQPLNDQRSTLQNPKSPNWRKYS